MASPGQELREQLNIWLSRMQDKGHEGAIAEHLLKMAEEFIRSGLSGPIDSSIWHDWLFQTGQSPYLLNLPDEDTRNRWAEAAFTIIQQSEYDFNTLFAQRVAANPHRILFKELQGKSASLWSYQQIYSHIREIATVFYEAVEEEQQTVVNNYYIESDYRHSLYFGYNYYSPNYYGYYSYYPYYGWDPYYYSPWYDYGYSHYNQTRRHYVPKLQ